MNTSFVGNILQGLDLVFVSNEHGYLVAWLTRCVCYFIPFCSQWRVLL